MKGRFSIFLLVACAALFGFGLYELFKLRYEVGDIYPEYSSLRSDPLGTMALYESLHQFPAVSVRRDFSAQNVLPEGERTTYLHLAASRFDWGSIPEDAMKEIDRFVRHGGRLVITFLPESDLPFRLMTAPPPPTSPSKKQKKKTAPSPRQSPMPGYVPAKEKWGFDFATSPIGTQRASDRARLVSPGERPLPAALDWHSPIVFTNLDSSWEAIYARGTNPVVIERELGAGSIVLATDSYLLSNEAMVNDRHAAFLAWLIGPARHVVFDEAHFGIVESSGVAILMRKYRLHGLAAGLILLAGLFVWKNSMSFLPPYREPSASEQVRGKEASAGFVNLLRRNIRPADVLGVCFEQWTKSLLRGSSHLISRVDEAQAVLEAENARAKTSREPVRAYREICRVLKGTTQKKNS